MKTKKNTISHTAYLDCLPQPILTTDNSGVILTCNRAAEKLFTTKSDKIVNKNIEEFLKAVESAEAMPDRIKKLDSNKTLYGQYILKTAGGNECKVSISISGVSNDQNELAGAVISIMDYANKELIFSQLEVINKTLSSLTGDYLANINKLTALCGELLGASCALYNRLNDGLLCSFGKWNTAPDHQYRRIEP